MSLKSDYFNFLFTEPATLFLQDKRYDRIHAQYDRINAQIDRVHAHYNRIDTQ